MTAREVADILYDIETLLQLQGEDELKSKAYGRAARALETTTVDIEEAARQGKITSIPGIGKSLGPEVEEIVRTGTTAQLEQLSAATPPGLLDMLTIRGLGAKKVRAIHQQLGVDTLDGLAAACRENRVAALAGFGAKSQEKILAGIEELARNRGKLRLDAATIRGNEILAALEALEGIDQAAIAGALRRGAEEIDHLTFVVESESVEGVEGALRVTGLLTAIEREGSKITGLYDESIRVHVYAADAVTFVTTLHRHTGAGDYAFMISLPLRDRGYELNEEGLFTNGAPVELGSEEELYELAGTQYIIPEIREGIDEVRCAIDGTLPEFLTFEDLRGVLHVHSTWSDGQNTIPQLAEHAQSLGYRYLLITDHSKLAFYANGLDERRLEEQGREIDELNKQWDPAEFRVLKGIECDILNDGSLDLADDALAALDAVVVSVHSQFAMPMEAQTERVCRALASRYTTILGHPTGRKILQRPGYEIDLKRVIDTAAELGRCIELNANPFRLDLNWRMIKYARRKGVMISINPDAHSLKDFGNVRYGVTMGRKGWLTPEGTLNTRDAEGFLAFATAAREGVTEGAR